MRKLVIIPSDSVQSLVRAGWSYEQLEEYYNPGSFFDEVYCLYPHEESSISGKIKYIQVRPEEIRRYLLEIKPDVVRGYGGGWASIYANAARILGVPVVVPVHDISPLYVDPSLKYADKVICMTKAVKEAVKKIAGVEESRIEILPNRVDIKMFSKRECQIFLDEIAERYGHGKFILHVGRKSYQKNLDTLIKALQYLPAEYKAIFLGVGDSAIYEELAKQEKVATRCFFENSVPKDELPYYYSWCDCMCTPSRWEGFGIVFIEAAACECVVVTSDISPMNEYLQDGKNAFLVKSYLDPHELAITIRHATEKSELTDKIKKTARYTASEFFDKNKIDEKEIGIYRSVMKRGADNKFITLIENEKMDDKKIILFGAGNNGKRLCKKIRDKVAFFVDNDTDKTGRQINGVRIISYETLLKLYKDYTIVVTPNDRKEIENLLLADGIPYMSLEWFLAVNQLKLENEYQISPEFSKAVRLINESENIVDLGCGTNPLPSARVAVDKYIEPIHRVYGEGKQIDVKEIESKGIKFIQADFEALPFDKNEFDLAYSHHVVEHIEHPERALEEMQRIAKKGIIMCPSIFAESIFGRVYHKWEITWRENLIVFIEKRERKTWFGEGPQIIDGKMEIPPNCNPFDMILNDGDWYSGNCYDERLRSLLRDYWYGHFLIMENVFVWEDSFDFLIIYNDGTIVRHCN